MCTYVKDEEMNGSINGTDTIAWTKNKIAEASKNANLEDFENYTEALAYWERFNSSKSNSQTHEEG